MATADAVELGSVVLLLVSYFTVWSSVPHSCRFLLCHLLREPHPFRISLYLLRPLISYDPRFVTLGLLRTHPAPVTVRCEWSVT